VARGELIASLEEGWINISWGWARQSQDDPLGFRRRGERKRNAICNYRRFAGELAKG